VNESAGEKLWKRRAQTALGNRRSDFHFSHSFNNNKLDDRDHFLQNAKTSVASLRRLITPTRNADHDQPGTLITFIGIRTFPSSSHMFRNLIPMLADKYHVVAPDFPGYGESSAPSVNDFDYSYERLATVTEKFTEKLNLSSYALYLSDIGSSVGFRLAVMHPERVTAMIVQNGDVHVEAINKEFSKTLFDYWADRSEKNAQVLLTGF